MHFSLAPHSTSIGRHHYSHFTHEETEAYLSATVFSYARIPTQLYLTLVPMLCCAIEGDQYAEMGKGVLLIESGVTGAPEFGYPGTGPPKL